jgi:tyrosine decarboxylase/aspartate 1-decarboxylase
VDAAYGGFILPFLDESPRFGLDVPGVTSVCLDPHKMGRAPIPSGALIVRDAEQLAVGATETPYVSTQWQAGVLSTRPGGAAAATWAALHAIGREGYRTQARASVHLARWFAEQATKKGYELARDPGLGIVSIVIKENEAVRDKLGELGWRVSLTTLVPGIRIACMPHVTSERLTEFLRALPKVLKPVGKHVRA